MTTNETTTVTELTAKEQEIKSIIAKLLNEQPRYRRQYNVGKKQKHQLEELGILHLMPQGFGFSDADKVLLAANEKGHAAGGFNADGEGDVVYYGSSELYKAIHS